MARQPYSFNMRRGTRPIGGQRLHTFQWERVVILILIVALIATVCICMPAMGYRDSMKELYVARMQTECDTAISYSKYLSRTASSNSNAQLAVIRSSIYSMDVINQSYASMEGEGKRLIDENIFSAIYTTLDNYFNKLTTGMNTSDQQTELTNHLETLRLLVINLN